MVNKAAHRLTTPLAIGAMYNDWRSNNLDGIQYDLTRYDAFRPYTRIRRLGGSSITPTDYSLAVPTAYHARTHARFYLGYYKHIPYTDIGFEPRPELYMAHALHIDPENEERIRYFDTVEHMKADRHTTTTLGRYLTKYYAEAYTEEEIRDISACFTAGTTRTKLVFRSTPEEIVDGYINGPRSCMSHGTRNYSTGGIHPTEAYGNSDLQLATLHTAEGHTTARVLVWPDEKVYGRIYGDTVRMREKIRAAGFKHGSFNGAKIRKVHIEGNKYLMPYVDRYNPDSDTETNGNAYISHAAGDFFILHDRDGSGRNDAGNTDGTVRLSEVHYCRDCESEVEVGDEAFLYHNEPVCVSCVEQYVEAWSGRNWQHYHQDDTDLVYDVDNHRFTVESGGEELSMLVYRALERTAYCYITRRDVVTVWTLDANGLGIPDHRVRQVDTWMSTGFTSGEIEVPSEPVPNNIRALTVIVPITGTFNMIQYQVHPRHRHTILEIAGAHAITNDAISIPSAAPLTEQAA